MVGVGIVSPVVYDNALYVALPIKIRRGLERALSDKGGLQYAPPIR